jgi:hypothetical protein
MKTQTDKPIKWRVSSADKRTVLVDDNAYVPQVMAQCTKPGDAALVVQALNSHAWFSQSVHALSEALSRYGRHDSKCPLYGEANLPGDSRCICGFSKALATFGGDK